MVVRRNLRQVLTVTLVIVGVAWILSPQISSPVLATDAEVGLIPTTPRRIVDTRKSGPAIETSPDGTTHNISLTTTIRNMLNDSDTAVDSVVGAYINITIVDPSESGYLTIHADPNSIPDASVINFPARTIIANAALVPIASGSVNATIITPAGPGSTHLLIDLLALAATENASISPLRFNIGRPERILDTRRSGTIAAGGDITINTGSTSPLFVNLTLVNEAPNSDTTFIAPVDPRSGNIVDISYVNAAHGEIRANTALLIPDAHGVITLRNDAGETHVLVDVMARLTNDPSDGSITMLDEPFRVIDAAITNRSGPSRSLGSHALPHQR